MIVGTQQDRPYEPEPSQLVADAIRSGELVVRISDAGSVGSKRVHELLEDRAQNWNEWRNQLTIAGTEAITSFSEKWEKMRQEIHVFCNSPEPIPEVASVLRGWLEEALSPLFEAGFNLRYLKNENYDLPDGVREKLTEDLIEAYWKTREFALQIADARSREIGGYTLLTETDESTHALPDSIADLLSETLEDRIAKEILGSLYYLGGEVGKAFIASLNGPFDPLFAPDGRSYLYELQALGAHREIRNTQELDRLIEAVTQEPDPTCHGIILSWLCDFPQIPDVRKVVLAELAKCDSIQWVKLSDRVLRQFPIDEIPATHIDRLRRYASEDFDGPPELSDSPLQKPSFQSQARKLLSQFEARVQGATSFETHFGEYYVRSLSSNLDQRTSFSRFDSDYRDESMWGEDRCFLYQSQEPHPIGYLRMDADISDSDGRWKISELRTSIDGSEPSGVVDALLVTALRLARFHGHTGGVIWNPTSDTFLAGGVTATIGGEDASKFINSQR